MQSRRRRHSTLWRPAVNAETHLDRGDAGCWKAGFHSPERSAGLGLENGELGAASPIGDGSETAGDRYQQPLTQRRRGGEAELAAVGVERGVMPATA